MRRRTRFRELFLRWDSALALLALVLPILLAMALGFLWLFQNGLLLVFIAVTLGFGASVALARLLLRRLGAPDDEEEAPLPEGRGVAEDPEWRASERAAFAAARRFIRRRTAKAVAWEEMPDIAREVITVVAENSGLKGKELYDFTVPEALLLVERVASQYRDDLKSHVPFSDSISLRSLMWIWRQRDKARRAFDWGNATWRVARAVNNPPAALMREVDGALAGGHLNFLTGEAMAASQAILLEEVAKAAVDLYSGRLRFSDAELLKLRLAYGDIDRARLASPDAPLRIAVAGQVSAGKSSVVNALIGETLAETDAPPTTDRAAAYEAEIDGMDCVFLDLPGLDGGKATKQAVLRQLTESDIVIWVLRANRPARETDRDAIADWVGWFDARPDRRRPPLIVVASFIDALVEGWPLPELRLDDPARRTISAAVTAMAEAVGTDLPIPVSLAEPEWNLHEIRHRLAGALGEGLMVQRNRARLGGGGLDLGGNVGRAGRGVGQGLRLLGRRLAERRTSDEGE